MKNKPLKKSQTIEIVTTETANIGSKDSYLGRSNTLIIPDEHFIAYKSSPSASSARSRHSHSNSGVILQNIAEMPENGETNINGADNSDYHNQNTIRNLNENVKENDPMRLILCNGDPKTNPHHEQNLTNQRQSGIFVQKNDNNDMTSNHISLTGSQLERVSSDRQNNNVDSIRTFEPTLLLHENQIAEEIENVDQPEEKEKNERTDVHVFASNVTMHGVYHIFATHNIPLRRFIWSIFFIVALTVFLYNCINRLNLYYSYPHVTAIEESSNANRTLRFPQITFCNLNNYRWRAFTPEDLIYSNELTGLLKWNPKIEEYELAAPKSVRQRDKNLINYLQSLLSLGNMFGLRFQAQKFSLMEFSNRTGHQLNDTLLSCYYRGEPCDIGRFKTIMTRFGKCYTFNAYQKEYNNQLLETLKGGIDNGLELLLDVQSTEYMPVWTKTDEVTSEMGFKVQIHSQEEPPLITELGFGVAPGFQTLVTTKEQRITFLPKPWGECTSNDEKIEGFEDIYRNYSVSACRLACEARFIKRTCGCKMVHVPSEYNVTDYCSPDDYFQCADRALDWLVEKDQSECLCGTFLGWGKFRKLRAFLASNS